ncbi:MAG: FAD-dependent oxidoreductase, partial [Pseudomonas sp.]
TFVWESETPLQWQAGQYLYYTLSHDNPDDRGIKRWFTIAAPPFEGNPRITTRFAGEKGSTFKATLHELQVGETIEATEPEGDFIVESTERPIVYIAGGIGITPYRAILLQLDHDGADIQGCLLYANRNDEYPFKDELEAVAERHAGFSISYFADPQHIELEDIQKAASELTNPLYYISGPKPMVEGYKDKLVAAGIPEADIKLDDFPGYENI